MNKFIIALVISFVLTISFVVNLWMVENTAIAHAQQNPIITTKQIIDKNEEEIIKTPTISSAVLSSNTARTFEVSQVEQKIMTNTKGFIKGGQIIPGQYVISLKNHYEMKQV